MEYLELFGHIVNAKLFSEKLGRCVRSVLDLFGYLLQDHTMHLNGPRLEQTYFSLLDLFGVVVNTNQNDLQLFRQKDKEVIQELLW